MAINEMEKRVVQNEVNQCQSELDLLHAVRKHLIVNKKEILNLLARPDFFTEEYIDKNLKILSKIDKGNKVSQEELGELKIFWNQAMKSEEVQDYIKKQVNNVDRKWIKGLQDSQWFAKFFSEEEGNSEVSLKNMEELDIQEIEKYKRFMQLVEKYDIGAYKDMSFEDFSNPWFLYLWENEIPVEELDNIFPKQIEELYLYEIWLKRLPEGLKELQKLRTLDLFENQIPVEKLDNNIPNVEYLNLNSMWLTRLPEGLDKLENLRTLNLWWNNISEEEIEKFKEDNPNIRVIYG